MMEILRRKSNKDTVVLNVYVPEEKHSSSIILHADNFIKDIFPSLKTKLKVYFILIEESASLL